MFSWNLYKFFSAHLYFIFVENDDLDEIGNVASSTMPVKPKQTFFNWKFLKELLLFLIVLFCSINSVHWTVIFFVFQKWLYIIECFYNGRLDWKSGISHWNLTWLIVVDGKSRNPVLNDFEMLDNLNIKD